MDSILSPSNKSVLWQFLQTRSLIAFDYDGTLAPIVPDPNKAVMRRSTRSLLTSLARRVPCVVISGRSRSDTQQFLRGIPLKEVIGNHGIEPWKSHHRIADQVRRLKHRVECELPNLPGVSIEDKIYSLSIHYRQSREKKRARSAILSTTAKLSGVRLLRGKQVVNIIPEDGPHKGIALRKAMEKFGCDTSIYLGDDVTDEDVFALDFPGEILSISVGRKHHSSAKYFIRNQAAVDSLVKFMLAHIPEENGQRNR